jgi:phosphopantetheinyl transferase
VTPRAEIWLFDLAELSRALFESERIIPRLAADDEARVLKIATVPERMNRRAAAIAQRLVMERMFGARMRNVTLPRDRHGRPVVPSELGVSGAFSLSHTAGWALVGCTTEAVMGVDLETPRAIRMPLNRRTLIEAASAHLAAAPLPEDGDGRFLQAWVRLEALAKADGRGIGHLLTAIGAIGANVNARAPADNRSSLEHLVSGSRYRTMDLDVGEELYAAAVVNYRIPSLSIQVASVENLVMAPARG